MPETVSLAIRDDIIAQEVRYRRVDASVRREVDTLLDQLESDIVALMLRVNVNGTKQIKARARRLAKLNRELGILIRTTYSEVNGLIKASSRRVSRVEAKAITKIVEGNLP